MASIQSQIKRNRQNEKRRLRNRDYRGAARTAVKDARAALAGTEDSSASVMAAISALDKAAQKGAIHHRNAARRKGRLLKRLSTLQMPGHAGSQPKPASAERRPRAAEQMPAQKSGAKAEKAVAPKAVDKSTSDPKKTAAKSATKKTTEKKPAAKKPPKK